MARKYKILGIAPYPSMQGVMTEVAKQYKEIELTVYTGNLEDGVLLAKQHMNEGYDLILSRGGTAEMLREAAWLPVVEIPISMDDILRITLLLGNLTEPCAIVGYPNITRPARALCEMIDGRMEIRTIHHPDELNSVLESLKENGYNLVICDTITEIAARRTGLEPILILSGPESIANAMDYAVTICQTVEETLAHSRLFAKALQMQDTETIILKKDGTILFSTYNKENISTVTGYLKKLAEAPRPVSGKAFHMIENMLYSILSEEASFQNEPCCIFCLEQNPFPVGGSKHGIRFSSRAEISVLYSNSFYSLTASARLLEEKIRMIGRNMLPVMILGERGSGKNQVAAKLYLESPLNKYPYVTIDCQTVNDKTWSYLTGSYNSPFNDRNNTIFISNIQELSKRRQDQLLSLFVDTAAHTRNRIIFSCSQDPIQKGPDPSKSFIDYLICTTICLPPLRELTDDILSSSKLYLNTLNAELSRQIVGFTPDALSLLTGYQWPDNYLQLKRVLAELAMLTTTAYIQYDTVYQTLEKEKHKYIPSALSAFNYDRPLGEMTREIVKVVLARCNGNQTLAAKKLGIGRTTLWRYLNEETPPR